jgi:hypothetical protein
MRCAGRLWRNLGLIVLRAVSHPLYAL